MLPNQPHSPSRRRLAKGAFASPIVLASLTAKDALATGKTITCSGNMSVTHASHQVGNTTCNQGQSYQHWCREYGPSNPRKVPDFFGSCFGKGTGSSARRSAKKYDNSWSPLTCHQLLVGQDYGTQIKDVAFMVKALCVYLNAEKEGYYINADDARNLYLSATNYTTWVRQSSSQSLLKSVSSDSGQVWEPDDSRQHIEILYRP